MSDSTPSRDIWSKFRDIATGVAVVAVPLVIALLGNNINSAIKAREMNIEIVSIAVRILEQDPSESLETPVLRRWAMEVVDSFSGVPLPEKAREELQANPIAGGSRSHLYTCPTVLAAAVTGPQYSVAVSESLGACRIEFNGSKTLAASCRDVNATVFHDGPVRMTQNEGWCHFWVD